LCEWRQERKCALITAGTSDTVHTASCFAVSQLKIASRQIWANFSVAYTSGLTVSETVVFTR